MLSHPLRNFKTRMYCQNEPRFNGDYPSDN